MKKNWLTWLHFVVEGQAVQRFHSRPGITPYTDAQHSHGVALLCWVLTEERATVPLLMAALCHDLAEQAASDVSAPAKRVLHLSARLKEYEDGHLQNNGLLFPLTAYEERVLKLADNLEGMLYCVRERTMGNKYVDLVYSKWRKWCRLELNMTGVEAELFEAIEVMWANACGAEGPMFNVYEYTEGDLFHAGKR